MSKVSKSINMSAKPKNALDNKNNEAEVKLMQRAYAAMGILCLISTVVFDKSKDMGGMTFPIMCLLMLGFFVGVLLYEDKLNVQNAVLLIIAAGFVVRLNYVIYTPLSETVRTRQHDLFEFGGTKGHSAYIEHFYNNGFTLPDFDPTSKAQFYHPPLHHFIAAMWMRILTTFGMGYTRAIGSLMFVVERILSKLRINGTGKLIALSIVAFHPTFIILSGSVNNDILSILFILLSVFTTLKWYENPTTKNILFIALSIGLGMSTKLSSALVSIPIAVVFFLKLINEKKKVYENFMQYCIFGVVCIPLGLWFSIRNAIKFKVPFTYVMKLSEDSDQYIGFHTVSERLFDYKYHPFKNVFLNRVSTDADYFEYNPFVAIIKTSMFGEYKFSSSVESITPVCRVLLIINMVMIAVSLAATVYFAIKKNRFADTIEKIFLVFFQILMFVYFVKFSFDFPHTCSMDYRYIVPTCVLGALFIGASVNQFSENCKNKSAVKAVNISVISFTSLFCLTSTIVFIMLGKAS